VARVETKLEVVVIPVSDVDGAKELREARVAARRQEDVVETWKSI
jgi:hypothetical protein